MNTGTIFVPGRFSYRSQCGLCRPSRSKKLSMAVRCQDPSFTVGRSDSFGLILCAGPKPLCRDRLMDLFLAERGQINTQLNVTKQRSVLPQPSPLTWATQS
jgi:hypothetical protein